MNQEPEKCVIVLDSRLPAGVIANTAAILGVTLGARRPDVVGGDLPDLDKRRHLGIIRFPIPVLRGDPACLRSLRKALFEPRYSDLTVVDFTDLAQGCATYPEFTERMAHTPEADLNYIGVALCGPKQKVNHLTGSLPLLR